MHLSGLLVFKTDEVGRMVWWIIAPFAVANVIFNIFYAISHKMPSRVSGKDIDDEAYLNRVERNLDWWFRCWIALTVVEVVYSGGFPIVWLLLGSSKTYNVFGLPFIHVFVSSLLSVLALAKLGLYLLRGDRRRLFIPIFQLLWSIVIVSRGVMIIALVQGVVLWICLKEINPKMLLRSAVIFIAAVFLFGYVGDARSGDSDFRGLAVPTANYPDWLPSGVLWGYVYITSPLGNLVNTSFTSKPSYDVLFPHTIYGLFPNPIKDVIYGKDFGLENRGDMVNESLGVSSAYIGPYRDNGYTGIACFSILIGIISAYFWKKRRMLRGQLLYSIIAECLVLTVFFNFLFYTPFLGQFIWIYLLFTRKTFRIFPRVNRLPTSVIPTEPATAFQPDPYREISHD
jgi:oligosaccharide repeat unit polymerase